MEKDTELWMNGFLDACRLIKNDTVELKQKINDEAARKAVESLFESITALEKSAFSYAPTVRITKGNP